MICNLCKKYYILKKLFLPVLLLGFQIALAQPVEKAFNDAFQKFLKDDDYKYATVGLVVYDLRTGKTVLQHNAHTGLAPASTQKIITAATAYHLLGKDFRYETKIGYEGTLHDGKLTGNIIIKGSGDPSFGSWRYGVNSEQDVINEIVAAVRQAGIRQLDGHVLADESLFDSEVIPDGWIWQDIGNYYGAGARSLNWRENQFDLYLKSGSTIGAPVSVAATRPSYIHGLNLLSKLTSAAAGTGDNAYIYLPLFGEPGYVRGTIPVNQNRFSISGTLPDPARQMTLELEAALKKMPLSEVIKNYDFAASPTGQHTRYFHTIESPSMDSICYWFLQKSINLYGEALIKTLGKQFGKEGSLSGGLNVLKEFWQKEGIDRNALKMVDGSGLSPQNRITADNLVQVLQFAKKQPWFQSWFNGFPTINGIKMKSGTIGGVIAYTGIIRSASGEYAFGFMVNNYNGSAGQTRRKMWKLLDGLK